MSNDLREVKATLAKIRRTENYVAATDVLSRLYPGLTKLIEDERSRCVEGKVYVDIEDVLDLFRAEREHIKTIRDTDS